MRLGSHGYRLRSATGKREPVQAERERAFSRSAPTSASPSGAHVRYFRAPGREPGSLATTCSGPPPEGTTIAWSVSAPVLRRNAIRDPSGDQTGFVSS